jgi:hypothetical protein
MHAWQKRESLKQGFFANLNRECEDALSDLSGLVDSPFELVGFPTIPANYRLFSFLFFESSPLL